MSILAKIRDAFTTKEAAKAATYAELVQLVADEGDVDPADVEETLQVAGKTLDDLEADVALTNRRRALEKTIAAAANVETDRRKLNSRRQQLTDQFAAAQREHSAKLFAIQQEEAELNRLAREAHAAEAELRRTAPPELHQLQQSVTSHRGKLIEQRSELQQRAKRIAEIIDSRRHLAKRQESRAYDQEIAAAEGRAVKCQEEIEKLDAKLAELDHKEQTILAEMLAV